MTSTHSTQAAPDQMAADAREGRFTAVFARHADAAAFLARISGEEAGFQVDSGTARLNRKGGLRVSWQAAPAAFADRGEGNPILRYWQDMSETVGYYGSTFGEYPFNSGARTAYLNGRAGQACM
jgi:hypothetical protein